METKQIEKPTTAFQLYLKAWKNLPIEAKKHYIEAAELDKKRYEKELLEKELEEEEEVKNLQIYLIAYAGGYNACGLDNGSKSYKTEGPVVKIIEYSEEEQSKWGVKVKAFQFRDKNSNGYKWTLHHNQKYHIRTQWGDENKRGDNVYTYGTGYNFRKDNPYNPIRKFHVCETPPKHIGTTTEHYTSFNNKTWTTYD